MFTQTSQTFPGVTGRAARPLWPIFACEGLSSVGAVMLMVGVFFFTEHYFRWGLRQNFLLAAAQGAVYVAGSLGADGIARRFGRRGGLMRIYALLALIPLLGVVTPAPAWTVAVVLTYTFTLALTWPALESLATSDVDATAMGRRVGQYNLVWSGTNALTFAASGAMIEHWRSGIFIVPAAAHLLCALIAWRSRSIEPSDAADLAPVHAPPEPELLAKRTLAMWLARLSLPSTYVVIYSLAAMMPLLPVMQPLDTTTKTVVGSVWMVARWLAFLYLGATVWWHVRPRILLVAAAAMLVAFVGVTVRPSDVFFAAIIPQQVDLASMVGWQLVLGAVMGVIYAGSLYFGMVLSDGSTEHGGYHEALIGLGSILGPGTAALTQWQWPASLGAGVVAVCCVIGLSVAAAGVATLRASRCPNGAPTTPS